MIERVFYRLPELAERWTCTVQDLLHLGIQYRAQVCVNIYGMAAGMTRNRLATDQPFYVADGDPPPEELKLKVEAMNAADAAYWARTIHDMPDGVFEVQEEGLRILEMPNPFPHELGEVLKFERGWWTCEFDPPVSIILDHLCMLHEEVQRLDREVFGTGAQASEAQSASAHLHPRAEATYLTIIGALLELVRTPRPGRDSDAAVIRELIDNFSDKPGISRTTLEAKFAEARRRLNST